MEGSTRETSAAPRPAPVRPGTTGPADSTSIRLILHGARMDRPEVRESVERLRAKGHDVEVRVTWEAGDAGRFARAAAAAGNARVVVAAGGDGTVSEVAAALAGLDGPALAILPLGTANDFAASAGVPIGDVDAALDLAASGCEATTVDMIRCGEKRFLNLATGGPGTKITAETPEGLKRALGGLSYAVAGAVAGATKPGAFAGQVGRIRGPSFEWSGAFLALVVGNGRQAGGGVVLCPDSRIDDGLLDVRVVPEGTGAGALLLDSLLHGREAALDDASFAHRAPWIEVETDEPLQINLDGEPVEGTSFRFEVEVGALRLVLPQGCPLVESSPGGDRNRTT